MIAIIVAEAEPAQSELPAPPTYKLLHVWTSPPAAPPTARLTIAVETLPETDQVKALVCAVARKESIEIEKGLKPPPYDR
jgi:hypothetical protein